MKREEILAKSRNERNDEYETKISKDSQTFGIFVVVGICILLFLANVAMAETRESEITIARFDYAVIIFSYMTGINIYSYTKTKDKKTITAIIGFGFVCVCTLILHFMNM